MFDPSPPPKIYNGQPSLFHGEFHIGNPPKELAEGIWLGHATGSGYVHVNADGEIDNWWSSRHEPIEDWNPPEALKASLAPANLGPGNGVFLEDNSQYIHVTDTGLVAYNVTTGWRRPEDQNPKFKKGDLVKYKKHYNNYGNCLATKMIRTVKAYIGDPHPGHLRWDGNTDPYWYMLEPEGHHWCDPEHGLELVSQRD